MFLNVLTHEEKIKALTFFYFIKKLPRFFFKIVHLGL